jgi:drug/metabolite transporter (DMT)-like permease
MSVNDFISTVLSSPYNPINIRRRSRQTKAYVALAMVCFFWGTTWLASRQGAQHMPPLQLSGMRQFLGGLIYTSFFLIRGNITWPRRKEWVTIFILGLLNFILSNGLSTWGVKYISAGLASIINAIIPLWLVVIAFFSNGSKPPARAIAGFVIGFGGICIIFYEHLHDFRDAGFSTGIVLSVSATLTWAFGTIYTKEHAKKFNPYFGIGLQMIISGIVLCGLSSATGLSVPLSGIPWQAWTAIAYLVIIGSVITFIAYLYALQHLSAEQTSLYAYFNPIVAILLGALLFHEKLTVFIFLGGLVTLYGVYLANSALKKMK